MNLKLLAWIALPFIGLIVVGWLVAWLIGAILNAISWVLGAVFYLVLAIAIVAALCWVWSKVRTKLSRRATS
ncbi:MAG TPA: hypothetical protein H9902_11875 [Candidatus Stackebrandtia faecavium]|nr:hypothetical protein [Candidatus Stackebrandtia faecavium]